MLANRNPDIPIYLEKYEKWKKEANKFKQDVKNGTKTEKEFKQWIEQIIHFMKGTLIMIGNPVDYDKKFKGDFPIFLAKFDSELQKYLNLIPGKEVLDLGIGQGRNSIPLSELDFKVTGVDYSSKCLEICKHSCPKLNLIQSDIRNFTIEKDKYDLII